MPEPPDTPSPEDAHPPPDKDRGTIPFSDFERPPERIGPYRILEVIGEGGMGTVYLAEQEEPIRRRVALKVIKLGMDTKEVVARFEAERQALAMMDHPNIAKVFDAGATEQGRPYFVMEYVAGEPITRYCDRHNLPPKDRLELLVQVCRAIQHAHQKGVIHRDIKASNVLVTIPDEKPVPKVIDFGVAKATSHRLTERTIFTEQGQLIGTPEYMSPEQAEMTGLNVDARTDIYSLGVLLYELLTGSLPFDPSTLRKAGLEGIQRMIREDEPPRPSTRISRLGDKATKNAQHRQMSVPALRRQLHGELDWVTMRAMAKDRARRYQSAHELAADIERYLSNDPVAAGPPSTVYRLKKYVSKHRTRWVGVAGFLAIVASAVVITLNLNSMQGRNGVLTSPPQTIAIMPFSEVNTGSASAGSSATVFGLQILMRQLIEKAGPLRVIDSELIKDTRKRLEADSSQPLTDREITHALGADRMLQCELDLTDRSQMVNWRLTRPADGKLLAERRVLSKNVFEAATDIMGTLVPLLYAEIDSFPPKTLPSPSLLFTESPEAFLEYTRGDMEARARDFRAAKAHFQKATDLDSTFALAALGWSQMGGGPRATDLAWEFRDRLGEKQLMKLQARRAFQSGRILESMNIHQQILDRWPDDKMLYLAVTSSLWSWWFAPEAIQWAERGLRYYPDDEMLLRWKWNARDMIGQSAEALEEVRIWLQAHPQSDFGWAYLGDLFLGLGLPDSAEVAYGRKMEATAREQLWDTVLVAYHRGDVAGAVAILEAGIEDILKGGAEDPWSDPRSINLIVSMSRGLAQMLADIGRLEEALHWIDEAATGNPNFGPTLDIFRRNLLMETGAFDRALNIEPLDASIQQLRDMPTKRQRGYWWRWEYGKVLCLEEVGNRDEARKIGEQLLADPSEDIADARLRRRILSAVLARMNEDFTSALDTLAAAEGDGIPYGHFNIIVRTEKARTLKAAGRLPEAIEEWSTLLRLYRGYFPALYHRARVQEMAGQISRAREDYQDFLDAWVGCDPGFSIVKDAQTRLSNLD